ncbi:MAG TPA: hypothetical protein VHN14_12740 [Kofleriaceae bacterium]|jgi:hypothetical protein|nr:hypothetical protein [Kofleriaceae bacterium]
MSITTSAFRYALTAAALLAATSTADAKPRRVVILDFDGPRQLADAGRSQVLSVLGEQYDVVATRRWEQARAAAAQNTHGPAQWSRAARQSGVDAVIEGWIQDEGRRKILNVVVREASNGREFDTISVRLDGKNGISTESSRQLQTSLDEVLDWIDAGQNEAPPSLPIINVKNKRGSSKLVDNPGDDPGDDNHDVGASRTRGRRATIDDDAAPAPAARAAEPRSRRSTRPVAAVETTDAAPAEKPASRPAARPDEPADVTPAAEPAHDARPVEVSTAEREVHEIDVLFPPGSEERTQVLGKKVDHVPEKTPRFMVDGGGYYGSRSLVWDANPDANITQFAGVTTKGLAINAAVYPFPTQKTDGILSGVGFTGSLHHSAGSTVVFDDTNQVDEYVLNQNGFELGVHYRAPLSGLIAVDGGAFYGNQTFEIVDASPTFEVPDTKYSYLGAGAHLDLSITDRATVGFGARYFTVLDAGDLASTDWFGPVSATGLGLEASFMIPLPASLYVRGQLAYQRISLETSGGGQITEDEGVTGGTDSTIMGNVSLGIAF